MTRIVAFWPFLEFVTGDAGATGEAEMVARTAARSPPPTRAGGQDDGANYQIPESIFLGSDVTPASESEFRADETSLSQAGVT